MSIPKIFLCSRGKKNRRDVPFLMSPKRKRKKEKKREKEKDYCQK